MDELSIQSNLLALNAAIEAAKAGEYGTVFAVVAKQMLGIDQSAIALTSIHQASTQNLVAYQQIQNAAQDLNDLSLKFKSLVDFYKL